jgi:glycosyltransferase involved in cell wall biosynthesis
MHSKNSKKIAIIGTVGVPARYGGFETLADNLVQYHAQVEHVNALTVWCSGKANAACPEHYKSAHLRYVNLKANGLQSIFYDIVSLWQALRSGHDRILLLGVSGALALPLLRLISRVFIVTNIDGIEWKREKWGVPARVVLRASEWAAVRFSHEVIADNQAIADHVQDAYARTAHVIAYGGDHAIGHLGASLSSLNLPERYALALCRIEPENNPDLILKAFLRLEEQLVFVGNWDSSAYGRNLRAHFGGLDNLYLLDPIYETNELYAVRARATLYVHGHTAGGTNPSLVEMMHFGIPVLAHGCAFNRHSTKNRARYFETSEDLASQVIDLQPEDAALIGAAMKEIALQQYTWDRIGEAYLRLLSQT